MIESLESIYNRATAQLEQDFLDLSVTDILTKVERVIIRKARTIKRPSDDHYQVSSRVPAYYNPNNHTVYLNEIVLKRVSAAKAYNVCYHELVHAISNHHTWKHTSRSYFRSGVKIEVYYSNNYECKHRALNEGITQYLTNTNTEATEPAYQNEVVLVQKIAKTLGKRVLVEAVVLGKGNILQNLFDARYGQDSFEHFSSCLDKKDYQTANNIIDAS